MSEKKYDLYEVEKQTLDILIRCNLALTSLRAMRDAENKGPLMDLLDAYMTETNDRAMRLRTEAHEAAYGALNQEEAK